MLRAEVKDGCWLWRSACSANGYGQIRYRGRQVLVHRLAYETFVGPIAPGQQIDHLCRNRACFNPEHLRACSARENLLAPGSRALAAENALKTQCVRGHPYDQANTYYPPNGQRSCRACMREYQRKYRRERKAARA
jgi:hypothetical protein